MTVPSDIDTTIAYLTDLASRDVVIAPVQMGQYRGSTMPGNMYFPESEWLIGPPCIRMSAVPDLGFPVEVRSGSQFTTGLPADWNTYTIDVLWCYQYSEGETTSPGGTVTFSWGAGAATSPGIAITLDSTVAAEPFIAPPNTQNMPFLSRTDLVLPVFPRVHVKFVREHDDEDEGELPDVVCVLGITLRKVS